MNETFAISLVVLVVLGIFLLCAMYAWSLSKRRKLHDSISRLLYECKSGNTRSAEYLQELLNSHPALYAQFGTSEEKVAGFVRQAHMDQARTYLAKCREGICFPFAGMLKDLLNTRKVSLEELGTTREELGDFLAQTVMFETYLRPRHTFSEL
jgi:hypothetical protein